MRLRRLLPFPALALCLALNMPAHGADTAKKGEEAAPAAGQAKIKEYYRKAFELYRKGGYSQAILESTEILDLDPTQSSAKKMLRTAREQIDSRDRKRQRKVFEFVKEGKYQEAFIAHQTLLDRDPTHPLYKKLERRLERIVDILPRSPSHRKAWRMAVKGLNGFLARKEDMQLAFNGLRYATELDRKESRFPKLLKLVTDDAPALNRQKLPKGTTIPTRKSEIFSTSVDNQPVVPVHVMQGLRETLYRPPQVARRRLPMKASLTAAGAWA